MQTLVSWAGMIRMIGEETAAQHVTKTYAEISLRSAVEALNQEKSSLRKVDLPKEVIQFADQLQKVASEMRIAVQQQNNSNLQQTTQEASSLQVKLRSILQRVSSEK